MDRFPNSRVLDKAVSHTVMSAIQSTLNSHHIVYHLHIQKQLETREQNAK